MKIRIRFSLRLLLIALTLTALPLGLWAERARREQAGVAWVRSVGGHVSYDFERPEADGSYPRNAKPPGPKWLRVLLGIEYFANVRGVILDRDEIHDLTPLTNFSRLKVVGLMNYVPPETDLSPLCSLKYLEELHLGYTGLDPSRLEPIRAALPHLRIEFATDPELTW